MHDRGLDRAGDRLHRRDCKIQPISLAWLLLKAHAVRRIWRWGMWVLCLFRRRLHRPRSQDAFDSNKWNMPRMFDT